MKRYLLLLLLPVPVLESSFLLSYSHTIPYVVRYGTVLKKERYDISKYRYTLLLTPPPTIYEPTKRYGYQVKISYDSPPPPSVVLDTQPDCLSPSLPSLLPSRARQRYVTQKKKKTKFFKLMSQYTTLPIPVPVLYPRWYRNVSFRGNPPKEK